MTNALRTWIPRTTAVALVAGLALAPSDALARGRGHGGGGRGGVVVLGGGGFYAGPWAGYGFGYWGAPWGFSPWGVYPPAYYQVEGGVPLSVAMMSGFGGVDLEVKPNRADVWVDGKYVGEARDFDGYPSYLWVKEGVHRVQVHKGGYRTFDEAIEVQSGIRKELKVRLQAGESLPPGSKPGRKDDERKGGQAKEDDDKI
jgi:hypothetical protein